MAGDSAVPEERARGSGSGRRGVVPVARGDRGPLRSEVEHVGLDAVPDLPEQVLHLLLLRSLKNRESLPLVL